MAEREEKKKAGRKKSKIARREEKKDETTAGRKPRVFLPLGYMDKPIFSYYYKINYILVHYFLLFGK